MRLSAPRGELGARLLRVALVAMAYFAAGAVGLELALVRGQVSPIWPATGVALFCLLRFGRSAIGGIAVGAVLVNMTLGPSTTAVVVIMVGNTLAPVTAWLLLRRVGFRPDLSRPTDALALIGIGGLGSMLISATCGTGALWMADVLAPGAFWPTWLVWWTGDAMGVLIVAPVLLLVYARRPAWVRSVSRWIEAGLLLIATLGVLAVVMAMTEPLLFACIVPLAWAAVRFQQFGAAPGALLISSGIMLAAHVPAGPFTGRELVSIMIILQVFNVSIALVALLLSSAIAQRDEATVAVEQTCRALADAVATLTDVARMSHGPLTGKPSTVSNGGPAERDPEGSTR